MKNNYKTIRKTKEFLDKTPKAQDVTLAKDENGYFVMTHRWRSKSYKTINDIPKSVIIKCESTG